MPLPRPLLLAVSVATMSIAASAQAEPKVHDMDPIKIVLKPSRPLVTEIASPPKNLASEASKQPVAGKIETAITASPF